MLKIIFGYGADDETAIANAIDEYNSKEGRKTYHESKVRQLQDNTFQGDHRFRCEIWYTLLQSEAEKQKEAEKYLFIGSEDINPNDPNWREKWEAQQDALKEQAEILEDAETDWFLNTEDFDGNLQVSVIPTVDLDIIRAVEEEQA